MGYYYDEQDRAEKENYRNVSSDPHDYRLKWHFLVVYGLLTANIAINVLKIIQFRAGSIYRGMAELFYGTEERSFKLIGLTGQSGAGKTTVLRCWAERGASVFDSDLAVKKIYESGSPCLKAVAAEFGSDILRNDGTLDRALLAQRAFSDPARTQALNELVHPFVTAELYK